MKLEDLGIFVFPEEYRRDVREDPRNRFTSTLALKKSVPKVPPEYDTKPDNKGDALFSVTTVQPSVKPSSDFWNKASDVVGRFAKYLHMSPIGIIALLVAIVVFLICICWICAIRAKNKKIPKNYGTRVDHFDDLPLPDFDEVIMGGFITYSICYDIQKKVFRVRLLDACGLTASGEDMQMDPYVVVSIVTPNMNPNFSIFGLETIGNVQKTKVQRDTCSPVFNEVFRFEESLDTVLSNWLLFNIFDYDSSGADLNYGYVLIRLNEMDSNAFIGVTIEETAEIVLSNENVKNGDLCIILKRISVKAEEELLVTLLEGRDLPFAKQKKFKGNIFVSACIFKEGKKKKWKKKNSSRMPAKTPHPYFNVTFRFPIPPEYMSYGKLVMKIIHLSPHLGIRETVARIEFGRGCETENAEVHWMEAYKNPNKAIPKWHSLNRLGD